MGVDIEATFLKHLLLQMWMELHMVGACHTAVESHNWHKNVPNLVLSPNLFMVMCEVGLGLIKFDNATLKASCVTLTQKRSPVCSV